MDGREGVFRMADEGENLFDPAQLKFDAGIAERIDVLKGCLDLQSL